MSPFSSGSKFERKQKSPGYNLCSPSAGGTICLLASPFTLPVLSDLIHVCSSPNMCWTAAGGAVPLLSPLTGVSWHSGMISDASRQQGRDRSTAATFTLPPAFQINVNSPDHLSAWDGSTLPSDDIRGGGIPHHSESLH